MARISLQAGQILQVARIGEFVEIDDKFVRLRKPIQHKIAANKPRAPGYKNAHGM
jgi:hypothetical protein